MTADGKIADSQRHPARFSSEADRAHLERQISLVDAVLFGASTLRAYGTSLPISDSQLLQERKQRGQALQPIYIVCSALGEIDSNLRFFQQPIPRWLLTVTPGAKRWQEKDYQYFNRLLIAEILTLNPKSKIQNPKSIDWLSAFAQLSELGVQKLAVLGGGELVASLLELDLIDEFWLTVCPVIFGGKSAPTPVGGSGFPASAAKRLELLHVENIAGEVFLHYRRQRGSDSEVVSLSS
jgi:riboflavin biosynthesis pyrimidine reductase